MAISVDVCIYLCRGRHICVGAYMHIRASMYICGGEYNYGCVSIDVVNGYISICMCEYMCVSIHSIFVHMDVYSDIKRRIGKSDSRSDKIRKKRNFG